MRQVMSREFKNGIVEMYAPGIFNKYNMKPRTYVYH